MIRKILSYALLLVTMLSITGNNACNDDDERFKILFFKANKLKASLNESITLSWDYSSSEISAQKLDFLTLTFSGIETHPEPLNNSSRSWQFNFSEPVDVMLEVTASDGSIHKAVLSVGMQTNFHFSATVKGTDPLHPFLGYPYYPPSSGSGCNGGSPGYYGDTTKITFTKFFGFFDGRILNGSLVDQNFAVDDAIVPTRPTDRTFRGLSSNFNESVMFGFTEGSHYPCLGFPITCPAIVADGTVLTGEVRPCAEGYANAILFGGAIATDGEPIVYKGEDGEGTARTGVTRIEPIFMTIVFWVDFATTDLRFVDIQLGNLFQGMVTTVTYNCFGPQTSMSGLYLSWVNAGIPSGIISGEMKQATSGWGWAPDFGLAEPEFVNITDTTFEMPFLPDNQIRQFIE